MSEIIANLRKISRKKTFKLHFEGFWSVFGLKKAVFGVFLKSVRVSFFSVCKVTTEAYPFFLTIFGISQR